jgi:GntR family transcriptional regulator
MGSVPAYRRIYEDIAGRIRSGDLAPEARLLGESILAEQYGVARMTVRQAIAQLVEENLVVRQQGVGTFVSSERAGRRSLNRLTSFTEDMHGEAATRVLIQAVIDPPPDIAGELNLGKGARAVHVGRVRSVAGKPVSVHYSYLPYGKFPSLAREPLCGGSLYRTLREVFGTELRRADQRIKAAAADAEVAASLRVPVGSPVLQTERLAFGDSNDRVEFARSWARPEIELTVHLER